MDIGIKRRENIGRKHTHQIVRELCKDCNTRNRFLTNRIATTWNTLPSHVVEAISVNSFKARLDKHMAEGLLRRSMYRAWTRVSQKGYQADIVQPFKLHSTHAMRVSQLTFLLLLLLLPAMVHIFKFILNHRKISFMQKHKKVNSYKDFV